MLKTVAYIFVETVRIHTHTHILWQAVLAFIHFQDMNSWYQKSYFH